MTVKRVLLILVLFLTACAKEEGYRMVLSQGSLLDVYPDQRSCVVALEQAAVVLIGEEEVDAYGVGYCIATGGQEVYDFESFTDQPRF